MAKIPTPRFNPDVPIPNNPFYSLESSTLQGPMGPMIVGTGFSINYTTGTINAPGGGGVGTVTAITAGNGLTANGIAGATITATGTLSLEDVGITTGVYTLPTLTVDNTGRILGISNGTAVTSITAGAGLSGGTITSSGTIGLAASGVGAGTYNFATFTVDAQGRVTAASSNTAVTSITAGAGLSGGTITSTGTISLPDTGVTAGTYTNASLTVDAKGRLTFANSGLAPVTSVVGISPIQVAGTSTRTITHATSGVTAASYTYANITVDATGHVTLASNGVPPVTAVTALNPLVSSGGATPQLTLLPTAVSPGSYTYASVTVDGYGRLTAASNGTPPVTSVAVTSPATLSGTATAPVIGVRLATIGQTGAVQVGTNVNVSPLGVISVNSASTSQAGVVQLNDTTSSPSTTLALTANQGYILQQQIDSLLTTGSIELAGTIDASTGFLASITSVGTGAGYTNGAVLPAASATTNNTYVIVTTPGTFTPPGGSATAATRGDWFLVSEVSTGVYAWTFLNVGFDAPYASTTIPGLVCLATNALAQAGTDNTTALTPANAASAYVPLSSLTAKGTLISASGACTVSSLPVGSTGSFLVADSACTSGLKWCALSLPFIPNSTFTAAGQLIAGTGSATYSALSPGTLGQILAIDGTCVGGMKWCTADYLGCSLFTAKGTLLSASAPNTVCALPVGSNGDVLTACSTAPNGLCWAPASVPAIPCACITGKGGLVTGTGASAPVALAVGNDGEVLTACSTAPEGLCWAPAATPSIPCACITAKGGLVTGTAANTPVALPVGTNGQILVPNSACTEGLEWITNPAILCSALTAKGDLISATAAGTPAIVNVGADGNILTACAGASSGLCWTAPTFIRCCTLTAKGDLIVASAANTPTALPVGIDGQFLVVNSACSTGVTWQTGYGDTPVGAVQWFARNTAPVGWFVADGSAISRTTYADLFAAIGTAFGAGNGTTTFNLPDLRGQFVRGWDSAGGTARGLDPGRAFGSDQGQCFLSHTHTVIDPGHMHCILTTAAGNCGVQPGIAVNAANFGAAPNGVVMSKTTGITNAACGGTETRPTNVAMLPCIKWQMTTAPSSCGIPCACITAKGSIVVGSGPASPTSLPVGPNGCALIANSACATGLDWGPASFSPATPTTQGVILGYDGKGSGGLGFKALCSLTTGLFNVGIAENAGCSITSGASNIAIGGSAMLSVTTGSNNVGIGYQAMACVVAGINNVAIGNQAGVKSTSSGNVFIGAVAGCSVTTSFRNTIVGEQAAPRVTTGDYQTALGWAAGCSITTGYSNTVLGALAGSNLTTGYENVAIGASVCVSNPVGNRQLAIGTPAFNWVCGDCNASLFFGGNLYMPPSCGISVTLASGWTGFVNESNNGMVLVQGATLGNTKVYQRFCFNTTQVGYICGVVNGVFYSNSGSDYRLKENVTPAEGASDSLRALPIYEYNYIDYPEQRFTGFMAHELAEVVPDAVGGTKDEVDEDGKPVYQVIDYSRVVPLLAAALKESIVRIDALEAKIAELESK